MEDLRFLARIIVRLFLVGSILTVISFIFNFFFPTYIYGL